MSSRAAAATRVSRPRRRGLWRLGMLGIILIIMAGYVSPLRSIYETSQQINREQAATAGLKQQHDMLVTEQHRLQDNTYVEQVARRDLGLVLPGEQAYAVKDLNKGDQPQSPPPAPPGKSWPRRALDSVESLIP